MVISTALFRKPFMHHPQIISSSGEFDFFKPGGDQSVPSSLGPLPRVIERTNNTIIVHGFLDFPVVFKWKLDHDTEYVLEQCAGLPLCSISSCRLPMAPHCHRLRRMLERGSSE